MSAPDCGLPTEPELPRCGIPECGKTVRMYSGLTEKGYCSEDCYYKDPETNIYRSA